jgi:type IV pilus assembly protein PilP
MKTTKTLMKIVAPAALFLAILPACGEDEEELVPVVKQEAKAAAAEVPAEQAEKPTDQQTYTYNAVNRRDPFKTYFDELNIEQVETGNLTELQRFEIDKLKLIAVVVGTATPMAMVVDPSGRGHTVKIGTLVGKRFGQVKHIRRGEIVVQEEFRDFTGKRIPQMKEMKLEEAKQ